MKTVAVNCYNCGSEDAAHYDTENGYHYVKCNNCGLVYLNPQPSGEEISESHKTGEHRGETTINVTGKYQKKKVGTYLNVLKDFYPKGLPIADKETSKWLDIGCGFGEFLEALTIFGKEQLYVKGSEPNQYKINSCLQRGLDVSFVDLQQQTTQYDFISLLNVYSHLPDPPAFIEILKKHLKKGGELLLQTGHSAHLPAQYHHKPYFAPDHISFANQEIVEDILKRAGFSILQTNIYRFGQFPKLTDVRGMAIQVAKIVLNKNGSIGNFFPKYPDRDMYIRARLD